MLFELATEEIPAAYQKNLYADWEKRLPQLLKATALPYKEVKIFASARRIAFTVAGIAERGEDVTETLQGPAKSVALGADGKPSPALIGFAKKAGIEPEKVEFKDSGKGLYASATITRTTIDASLRFRITPSSANAESDSATVWSSLGSAWKIRSTAVRTLSAKALIQLLSYSRRLSMPSGNLDHMNSHA